MEFITGTIKNCAEEISEILRQAGTSIVRKGTIHKIREMSGFAFIILRTGRDLIQCVCTPDQTGAALEEICEGCTVLIHGEVIREARASNGFEIGITKIEVLSKPAEPSPVVINKKKLDISLDTHLHYRPIALRNPGERAIFKIQEGIARGFREFLLRQNFTEIRTPKIVFAGAEGGANLFKMDYFGKEVFLAQSPQFYKQAMVGVFERVFEIAPVYRAEKHNTSRHLNEYISMDFEMGFIESFTDIMEMETELLKYVFRLLQALYHKELELLAVKIPEIEAIPAIKFMEAKETVSRVYNRRITDFYDFEPEEEQLLCAYMHKQHGCEFVFVTHYPAAKRPFYAMDDPSGPEYTLSFDLLFRGLEVTTGGQRIHDFHEQVDKMIKKGINPDAFESYLMNHKYGLPPHGGLGAGLERLTMKLLDLDNIRLACLFPRDMTRVTP